MKRFLLIFFSLATLETVIFFSPIRIDKIDSPNARFSLSAASDTLEIKYDGHLFVKVYINGDTSGHWFLWDTGAQASFIDEELVRQYDLREIGIARNIDTNLKAIETIRYRIPEIKFNNAVYKEFHFSSLHIEKPKCAEKKHRGIIGANIISNTNWVIDYQNQRMYVLHPDSVKAGIEKLDKISGNLETYSIPFSKSASKGVPKIQLNLNGEKIDDVIFDTGYNGSIVLPLDIYNKNDSLFGDNIKMKSFGEVSKGLFGTVAGQMLYLNMKSVDIGNLNLQDQIMSFQSKTVKLLGNGILKNFIVSLKYNEDEILLHKVPVVNTNYSVRRRSFGFNFKKIDESIVVSMIQENSPASNAGLEYQDEILCINEARFEGDECAINEWYSNFLCETILLEIEGKGTLELEYVK